MITVRLARSDEVSPLLAAVALEYYSIPLIIELTPDPEPDATRT